MLSPARDPAAGELTDAVSDLVDELCERDVRVSRPGDADFDAARRGWQRTIDQRPAAVAMPVDKDQVIAVVAAARRAGLRVAPQATGHNANALGPLDGTMLVKTSALGGVRVDFVGRRARVGAGVLWKDVVRPTERHGLVALHGSSPVVGVVGYSLGGGLGFYARRYGLQANRIIAAEIVTGDGRLRRIDDDHHPELLWSLRGGGGNFGIVTALEFELMAPRRVCAGALFWTGPVAQRVFEAWSAWAPTAPEAITTSARILRLPVSGDVPAALRGRDAVMIDGAVLGDDREAARILRPLRQLRPDLDSFRTVTPGALLRLHGDPTYPTGVVSDHLLLGEMAPDTVEAFVTEAGDGSGPPVTAELRQLGGALSRAPGCDSAIPTLDAAFLLHVSGRVDQGQADDAVLCRVQRIIAALEPWSTGRAYLNWAHQFGTRRFHARDIYDVTAYDRLVTLRARLDPDQVFQPIHPIPVRP